jgi:hypothetical protein
MRDFPSFFFYSLKKSSRKITEFNDWIYVIKFKKNRVTKDDK